jgi:hypothetical protein
MVERLASKRDRHGEVRMDLAIPKILRHKCDKHVDLFLLPAQFAREQRQAEALESFSAVDLVPAAELFHEGVFGPAVGRPHEHALLDVDEACFAHHVLVSVADIVAHGSARFATGFTQQLAPSVDVGADVCAIRRADWQSVVLQLEPSARFEVPVRDVSQDDARRCVRYSLVSLPEEFGPILEAA